MSRPSEGDLTALWRGVAETAGIKVGNEALMQRWTAEAYEVDEMVTGSSNAVMMKRAFNLDDPDEAVVRVMHAITCEAAIATLRISRDKEGVPTTITRRDAAAIAHGVDAGLEAAVAMLRATGRLR